MLTLTYRSRGEIVTDVDDDAVTPAGTRKQMPLEARAASTGGFAAAGFFFR